MQRRILQERARKGEEEQFVMLGSVNATSLKQNMGALIKSKAKVILFQEHKIR